jgi:hypothetical protein
VHSDSAVRNRKAGDAHRGWELRRHSQPIGRSWTSKLLDLPLAGPSRVRVVSRGEIPDVRRGRASVFNGAEDGWRRTSRARAHPTQWSAARLVTRIVISRPVSGCEGRGGSQERLQSPIDREDRAAPAWDELWTATRALEGSRRWSTSRGPVWPDARPLACVRALC